MSQRSTLDALPGLTDSHRMETSLSQQGSESCAWDALGNSNDMYTTCLPHEFIAPWRQDASHLIVGIRRV
jgi:hypothetical protein